MFLFSRSVVVRMGYSALCQNQQLFRQDCPVVRTLMERYKYGGLFCLCFMLTRKNVSVLIYYRALLSSNKASGGIHWENWQLSWSRNLQTYHVATLVVAPPITSRLFLSRVTIIANQLSGHTPNVQKRSSYHCALGARISAARSCGENVRALKS